MKTIRGTALAIAGLFCLASANHKSYTPKVVAAPEGVEDVDLYAATIRVFTDRGWSLRDKDVDAGMVSTEWIAVFSFGSNHTLHSWRAMISEGELRLAIDCEIVSDGSRTNCSGDQRVDSWVRDEPSLRAEIFAEAKRRANKRAVPAMPDAGIAIDAGVLDAL